MSTDEFRLPFIKGTLVQPEPHRDRDQCDLSGLEGHANASEKPIAIDLFSGAGGLSLGLQQAGFDVILGVDKESDAVATHGAYFGGASHRADLSDEKEVDRIIRSLENVNVALVAGGPPCQPFSRANEKVRSNQRRNDKNQDDRAGLWKTFLSVIEQVKPRAVLFENVPDLAFGSNADIFMEIVVALEDIGYSVHTRILSSGDYGVPQHRQRLFIVAVEQGIEYKWPRASQNQVTLADAIADLPVSSHETPNPAPYQQSDFPSALLEWLRTGVMDDHENVVYDHTARRVRPDDLEIYQKMEPGQIYDEIVPIGDPLRRYGKDDSKNFKDRRKRLSMLEPCRTITAHIAKDGYWYIHPEQDRTLTVREAARVQSFPDWFRFHGYPTAAYRQIGNSVPPLLSKALAEEILGAIESSSRTVQASVNENNLVATSAVRNIGAAVREGPSSRQVNILLGSSDLQLKDKSGSPWLYSGDPWELTLGIVFADQVVAAEAGTEKIRRSRAWARACKRWPTPADYIKLQGAIDIQVDDTGEGTSDEDLFLSFSPLKIPEREVKSTLGKVARWREANPEDDFVKGIDRHVPMRFKTEISSLLRDYNWSRLPVKSGPIRVADRLYGCEVGGTGANSRLNLARALARARDRRAYIVLCEIADLYCHSSNISNMNSQGERRGPECFRCPLNSCCITGSSGPGDNTQLPFLSPEMH